MGELKTLMAQLGHDLSDEQLSIMIDKVDQDGNGEIDFEEFVDLFKMEVPGNNSKKKKRSGSILMMENSEAPPVREAKQGPERRRASITSSLCDSIDPTALNRHVIEETWNNAKLLISFNRMLQIVTWLYSQRKMILLACSHFIATVIIWSECTHLETALTYMSIHCVSPLTFHPTFSFTLYLLCCSVRSLCDGEV